MSFSFMTYPGHIKTIKIMDPDGPSIASLPENYNISPGEAGGFVAVAAAALAAEFGRPTMSYSQLEDLTEVLCDPAKIVPLMRELLALLSEQRTAYVNDNPLEFIKESAHGFVTNPQLGDYEVPQILDHLRRQATQKVGGGRVHCLRGVQCDPSLDEDQDFTIDNDPSAGEKGRVWWNERVFHRHGCEREFVKQEIGFREQQSDAHMFVHGSDGRPKLLAEWARSTFYAMEENHGSLPPIGTDVLLCNAAGKWVVLLPVVLDDAARTSLIVVFAPCKELFKVPDVYSKVVGAALFGNEWSGDTAFRHASINDEAVSPKAWDRSSLASDPLGPQRGNEFDADHATGMPNAPWVMSDLPGGAEWVPTSPRSPRRKRLEKAQEALALNPEEVDWNAAALAHSICDEDRDGTTAIGSNTLSLHDNLKRLWAEPSKITVENLIGEALDFADVVYVALGIHNPTLSLMAPQNASAGRWDKGGLRNYIHQQFPPFLQEMARGTGDWDLGGLPSMVLVLIDPAISKPGDLPGFNEHEGWELDSTVSNKCEDWLWRLRHKQHRNLVAVIAKAGNPTPSTFMTWGIRSQLRDHQRFYFGDFGSGNHHHGELFAHAAAMRFGTRLTDNDQLDKVKNFWDDLMYDDSHHSNGIQLVQSIQKDHNDHSGGEEVMVLSSYQLRLIASVYSRQYGSSYQVTHSEHKHLAVDATEYRLLQKNDKKLAATIDFKRNISLGIYDPEAAKEDSAVVAAEIEAAPTLEEATAKRKARAANVDGAQIHTGKGLGLAENVRSSPDAGMATTKWDV